MKKLFALFALLVVLFLALTSAHGQDTNSVTVTPDQLTKLDSSINSLIPLLPAKYQGAVTSAIAVIGLLGILGRVVIGWRNNGIFGVFSGLFGGTNAPKILSDQNNFFQRANQEAVKTYGSPPPAKGATLLILCCLALPALLLTGCAGTQVVNFSKGTGLDLDLPLGYNGANIFEMKMKLGQFYTATAVQHEMTNAVFVAPIAFASTTDGSVTAPQIGATNVASVTGGDKFTASIGAGSGSISNFVGTTSSSGK